MVTKRAFTKGGIILALFLLIGIGFIAATGQSSLKKIDINTCTGSGSVYLYEGSNPFQPIKTSFTTDKNQLLIFAKPQSNLNVEVNGNPYSMDEIFSETDPFTEKVYLVNTTAGDLIEINGVVDNKNARWVQGYITQNKENPVYDLSTLKLLYKSKNSMESFLTPGEYSFVFFDKYTENGPGQGIDLRNVNVKVEGDSVIFDKDYNQPSPVGTQGGVVDNFLILNSGNYTLSIDSEDSIYYPFVECPEVPEPYCGDGNLDQGEFCDDGNNDNNDLCRNDCTIPRCGDGIKDSILEEQCDDGNTNNNDLCRNDCTIPQCGDGHLDLGEQCDDGNLNNNDGCSNVCNFENGCIDVVKETFDTSNNPITPVAQFEFKLNGDEQIVYSNSLGHAKFTNVSLGQNNVNETIPSGWQLLSVTPANGNVIVTSGPECVTVLFKNKQIINQPFCGDGNLDQGELCDDGNTNNADSCRNDCTIPKCGDNVIDYNLGEVCDDGLNNGEMCVPEYGNICNYCTSECQFAEVEIFCGDGILQQQYEQCDDGNNKDGDGCSSECTVEEDEPYCGDGIVNQQSEFCDDGNLNNSDSCRNDCTLPYCGDGIKDVGEFCDDGNNNNNDGCSSICEIEEPVCEFDVGVRYSYSNSFDTGIAVRQVGEDWIDSTPAELIKGNDHQIRYYVDNKILGILKDINITVKLDDDVLTKYQKDILFFHSKSIDLDISSLECDSYHDVSIYVDKVDEVDCNIDDNFAQREIYVKCEEQPYCGDGVLDLQTEQCDDGNNNNGDGCSSTCTVEEDEHFCGDGVLDQGEFCDDGNQINGDGCSSTCQIENGCIDVVKETFDTSNNPITPVAQFEFNLNNGEEFAFSNSLGHAKFTNVTPGINNVQEILSQNWELISVTPQGGDVYVAPGNDCSTVLFKNKQVIEIEPYCGDGNLDQGEFCDDGNTENGDGCSSQCTIEEEEPFCGDGHLDVGEMCDDGNNNNDDGCSSTCEIEEEEPYCGDGIINLAGEQCDDGNNFNGDGCNANCKVETPQCVGTSCGVTPNITTENFPPKLWLCDSRVVYDDGTEPGRISLDGQELIERINNYAFEGEQVSWRVLVMDKNGLEKIKDVYATVDKNIEANCHFDGKAYEVEDSCNARILEEELTGEDLHEVAGYYTCTFTVETPSSMYGESKLSVEAEDLDGIIGEIDEKEYWFFNPSISLGITGGINFNNLRPGTSSYSDTVLLTNNADSGSGVLMDMFISGSDFYDSASSGAKCPATNQLALQNFRYYATNGGYSTQNDARKDSEGYVPIKYGISFNNPSAFYDNNEVIQSNLKDGPYYLGNILSPGADMSLTFRLDLPEPCNGDFDSGSIYFWGEAI